MQHRVGGVSLYALKLVVGLFDVFFLVAADSLNFYHFIE
jgi:hypothetical protein